MSARKSFYQIRRSVADLTRQFRRGVDESVSHFGSRFEDVMGVLENRFGRDDSHVVFRALPEPRELDMSLSDALRARRSQRMFSDEPLTDSDTATVLWAADGITRKNGRRTTPSALDWREIEIYLLKSNGIWRWVPEKNGLIFCDLRDVRADSIFAEPSLHSAPVHLVYVCNRRRTETWVARLGETVASRIKSASWSPQKLEEMRTRSMILDAGVKIQAVYMAAAALGLACVARTGFDRVKLQKTLRLPAGEDVIAVQTLGYPAKSLLDTIK